MGCRVSRVSARPVRDRVGAPDGAPSSSLAASASPDVLASLVNALRNSTAGRCVRIYVSVSSDDAARSLLVTKYLPELRKYLSERCGVDASFVVFDKIDPKTCSVARAIALRLREIEACDVFVGVCGASPEERVKALLQLEASSEHNDHVGGVSSHVNQLWRDFPNMRPVLTGGVFGVGAVERHFARTVAKDTPALLFYERNGAPERAASAAKKKLAVPVVAVSPSGEGAAPENKEEAADVAEGLPVSRLAYRRSCPNGRDCDDAECAHCAKEMKKSLQNIARATAATLPTEERALDGSRKCSAAFEYSGPGTCAEELCRLLRMAFALALPAVDSGIPHDGPSLDNSFQGGERSGSLTSAERRALITASLTSIDRRNSLTSDRRPSTSSYETRRGSVSSDRRGSLSSSDRRGSINSDRRGSTSSGARQFVEAPLPMLYASQSSHGPNGVETATSSMTAPFPPPIVLGDPHRAFMRVKAQNVPVGDSRMRSLLERIDSEFAESPDGLGPVIACGAEGMGKSSLAACWIRREYPWAVSNDGAVQNTTVRRGSLFDSAGARALRSVSVSSNSPRLQPIVEWDQFVFYHYAGCTPESLLASNMLVRLCRALSTTLNAPFDEQAAESGLERLLARAGKLILAAHKRRINVCIVIDDFDLLAADDAGTAGLRVSSKSSVSTARRLGSGIASGAGGSSLVDGQNSVTINASAVAVTAGGGDDVLGELRTSSRTSIHSVAMPLSTASSMLPRYLPHEALSFARILLTTSPKGACEPWMRLARGLRRVALGTLDAGSRKSIARAIAARLGLPPLTDAELRSISEQRYSESPLFIEALLYCRRKAPAACGTWPLPAAVVPAFVRHESATSVFGSDSSLANATKEFGAGLASGDASGPSSAGGSVTGGLAPPKMAGSAAPSLADIFDACASANTAGTPNGSAQRHALVDKNGSSGSGQLSAASMATFSGVASTLTSSHEAIQCLASFSALSTAVRASDLSTYLNVAACIASARRGISEDEARAVLGMSQEAWSTAMVAIGLHVIPGPGGRLMFSGRCMRAAALNAHDMNRSLTSTSGSSLPRPGDIPPMGKSATALERRRSSLTGPTSPPLLTSTVRQQLSAHYSTVLKEAATRMDAVDAAKDLRWALSEPRPLPGGYEYVSDLAIIKQLFANSRQELLRVCKAVCPSEAAAAQFFFNRVLASPSARADEHGQQASAWVLDYLGHSKLALHAYDAAIRVQEMRGYASAGPDSVLALLSNINSLAMINEDVGDYERAAECYEKALRLLGWTVERAYEAFGAQVAARGGDAAVVPVQRVASGVGGNALVSRSGAMIGAGAYDAGAATSLGGDPAVRREWERVAATLSNLAAMQYIMGRYPQARATFESAYGMCDRHLGSAHGLTETARKWLFFQPWPTPGGTMMGANNEMMPPPAATTLTPTTSQGPPPNAADSPFLFTLQ